MFEKQFFIVPKNTRSMTHSIKYLLIHLRPLVLSPKGWRGRERGREKGREEGRGGRREESQALPDTHS